MSQLTNPRYEAFSQALANGESASKAYVTAGFRPNRANACRLKQDERIKQRIAQILAEKARKNEKATAKALESLALTREWVLSRLAQNAEAALADNDRSAANRALELIGKEQGMFIERRETGQPGDFSALESVEEIIAKMRADHDDATADALAAAIKQASQAVEPSELEQLERGDDTLN